MADSNSTKSALADAMKKLMVCKSFAKISISDLCEECGLNRKSFYYHFKDKYDLVNWIFYVDFLTNMGGKNFENEWDVLVAVCNIFYQNKAFYQSALRIEGQNSFKDYFYEMLEPVMAFFVQDLFQVQNQKLFVTFFCDAFLTAVLRWFSMESELEPETFVEELKEVICRSSEKIAAKVKETGREYVMDPMTNSERKIIHKYLSQIEGVESHSEGDDPNRYVVVTNV